VFAIFETPVAALLVAAGAASLPVIVHLLNRKRYRVVNWAAMRFLLAAQRKNTRRMRLEQMVLLAVRTLMVLLLVLAMASVMPWSEALWLRLFPRSAAFAATGSRRIHKILVLDGSFSMAQKTGDNNCFERARGLAARILHDSSSGDGFSVVLMAAPPRRIVPEASDDARKTADEVESLRLPHGNADLSATLAVVDDLLRESPVKFDEREVYFLSDLQRSTWLPRSGGKISELLQQIQARARVIFVDVGPGTVSNSAVTSVRFGTPLVTSGALTPITALVHHYGSDSRQDVRAELLVGKARELATDSKFALRIVGQMKWDIEPGQNLLNFSYKFPAPGEYAVQVRLDNDTLELDDSRTVIVTVKDTVPVMLVNGKQAAEPYDRAAEWLSDALNPFQGAGLIPRTVPARPRIVTESAFADAYLGNLTPYDCVFFCDVPRLSAPEIRRLETHLHRGGGVVFCLGPQVDLESYNRLLYRSGDGILPARLLGVRTAPDKQFFNFYAEEKAFHEPPLDAFSSAADQASLLSARFRSYVRAELPGRARQILSFLAEGPHSGTGADPALVTWQRQRGRVLLFTSTVNMDWTTWPISPSFPALMQELLQFALAGRLREQEHLAGEILEAYLPPEDAGLDVSVQGPEGGGESAQTELRDDVGVLRWSATDISGIYRATIGAHPQEYLFAVNVPVTTDSQQGSESDLARTDRGELEASFPGCSFQLVTDLSQVTRSGGPVVEAGIDRPGRGLGTVLARWLLLGMLTLVVLEIVLAWRFGHYTAVPGIVERPPGRGRVVPLLVGIVAAALFMAMSAVLGHACWTGDFLGFLPESFRNRMEAGFGIAPPAPGEGSRWHLEFTPYLWDGGADPWLVGGLTAAFGALTVAIYLQEGTTASRTYKLLLSGLRLFFVLLTLTVLLPQVRLWFERDCWPDIAVIIDDSRSMSTVDRYEDPQAQELALRLAEGGSAADRLQLAQALLTGEQHQWLETLLTRRRFKLHVYHCSTQTARISNVTETRQLPDAVRLVRDLRATGESSQLGGAVRQAINDFRGSSLAAVIMLTDGVTTEGEDLPKVARYAAGAAVPLYLVGIGDTQEARDLKLHDLQVEDSVYVNDRIVFEGRLTAQGYTERKTVPVSLLERDKDGKLKPLGHEMVTTEGDGKPVKFRLTHQPTEPGERKYVIEVPEQADEVKPADNNRLERVISVRESKIVKVLYIEGYPRYDYRFLKTLLERESDLDRKNKAVDLKVLLLDADNEYASEDKSALSDFPTREELNSYDVVILGDADPKDAKLGPKNLQHLADFVRERGGGFLMIAGPRFSPQAYRDSPLRDILPIQPTSGQQSESELTVPFRPERTAVGRFHPILRFSSDEAENTAIWNHLPEIFWWSEGYRVQPAVEVLLVHPKRKGAEPRLAPENGHPLLVQQFVGAGRAMFLGIDETWRWRFREDELRFNQFWIQVIRHLARSRQGRVELRLDRQTPYRRGQPIKVSVRFPDDKPPPGADAHVEVLVARSAPRGSGQVGELDKETMRLNKVEGSRATFEGLLTRTPEGDYRFWLSAPVLSGAKPHAEARVLPPPGELEQLRMNQTDLEYAALQSRGRFYSLADAERLIDELPAGTRIALSTPQPPQLLWNHGAMFALALGLLGAEWLLRKRKHLL
jgi:uncharacterized membrane protein/Mg-chelatase subunit ChlD